MDIPTSLSETLVVVFSFMERKEKKIFVKLVTLEANLMENKQAMEIHPTLGSLSCYENVCSLPFMLSIKSSNCKS